MSFFGVFLTRIPDRPDVCVLTLRGELGSNAEAEVSAMLAEIESDAAVRTVVVDLRPVDYLYSGVANVLRRAQRRAGLDGRRMSVVRPRPGVVDKALVATGVGRELDLVDLPEQVLAR